MSWEVIDANWAWEISNFPEQDCWNLWQQLVSLVLDDIWVDEQIFADKRYEIAEQMQRVASVATRVTRPNSLDWLTGPINAMKKNTPDIPAMHIVLNQFTSVVRNLIEPRN